MPWPRHMAQRGRCAGGHSEQSCHNSWERAYFVTLVALVIFGSELGDELLLL